MLAAATACGSATRIVRVADLLDKMDRKIEFAALKVLSTQARIIEQREKIETAIRRLEREAENLEDIKKEWIRKRNVEEERARAELNEIRKAHRLNIEDLRVRYEKEREDRLRDIKVEIQEEEREINEWRKKRDEAVAVTRAEETKIKDAHQQKLNMLLRDEQAASRRGVVRQRRLIEAPNVYAMDIERNYPGGVKTKRGIYHRRFV